MDWQQLRDEFPITRNYNFQNHAAVAPLCRAAIDAAKKYLDQAGGTAYLEGNHYRHAESVRGQIARLINAHSDEICFTKNTSEGLSFVANGLNWNTRDNIVTTNVEFPANVYCWQALRKRGVELRIVLEEEGRLPLQSIFDAIDGRTRLVAISSIQFVSGYQVDLRALGEFCQSHGVFLCVDGIQSVGAFPIDLDEMKVDFLSADGHKWLCGPEGAGFLFVRKDVQGLLTPTVIGWMSMKNATNFDHPKFAFRDSARRYESGVYNLAGIYALGGALDLISQIGVEQISSRLLELTDMLVTGVKSKGYRLFSPRNPGEASAIVSFISDVHDHAKIQKHLQEEHRLIISVRGGRLRSSPHMYNSKEEIQQLIDLLPTH